MFANEIEITDIFAQTKLQNMQSIDRLSCRAMAMKRMTRKKNITKNVALLNSNTLLLQLNATHLSMMMSSGNFNICSVSQTVIFVVAAEK